MPCPHLWPRKGLAVLLLHLPAQACIPVLHLMTRVTETLIQRTPEVAEWYQRSLQQMTRVGRALLVETIGAAMSWEEEEVLHHRTSSYIIRLHHLSVAQLLTFLHLHKTCLMIVTCHARMHRPWTLSKAAASGWMTLCPISASWALLLTMTTQRCHESPANVPLARDQVLKLCEQWRAAWTCLMQTAPKVHTLSCHNSALTSRQERKEGLYLVQNNFTHI